MTSWSWKRLGTRLLNPFERSTPEEPQLVQAAEETIVSDDSIIAYHVKVSTSFTLDGVYYTPFYAYTVPPETYNASLDDGRKFKDVCRYVMPKIDPKALP